LGQLVLSAGALDDTADPEKSSPNDQGQTHFAIVVIGEQTCHKRDRSGQAEEDATSMTPAETGIVLSCSIGALGKERDRWREEPERCDLALSLPLYELGAKEAVSQSHGTGAVGTLLRRLSHHHWAARANQEAYEMSTSAIVNHADLPPKDAAA
jgi:hypothetical protein